MPLAGISHGSLATWGIGVRGEPSSGIGTTVVWPPVVRVTVESVDAPAASRPPSSSAVDWRSSSGIVRVMFTWVSGITSPGVTASGTTVDAFTLMSWMPRFRPPATTSHL